MVVYIYLLSNIIILYTKLNKLGTLRRKRVENVLTDVYLHNDRNILYISFCITKTKCTTVLKRYCNTREIL
jgi:hypothetical protein